MTEEENCPKCTVISCSNYYVEELSESFNKRRFFSFPTSREVARKWKEKCGIAAHHIVTNSVVCSDHFKYFDFIDLDQSQLKPDAIPTENLGWMLGMPEVKPGHPLRLNKSVDFALVKEAVDTNEQLKKKKEELLNEKKMLGVKCELYKKKIVNVDKEINRLETLIGKYAGKRNWKIGSNLIFKVFSRAQINFLMGKKKVVWSYDDMAMAFALRHLGSRECYLYLKDTLNFPLPALSAVQRWAASHKMLT